MPGNQYSYGGLTDGASEEEEAAPSRHRATGGPGFLPDARNQSMGHARHIGVVPRQLASEKALFQAESDEHERERDARDQDCEVGLEPQSEADQDQWIRGVEGMT